jgi:hypothetical protein
VAFLPLCQISAVKIGHYVLQEPDLLLEPSQRLHEWQGVSNALRDIVGECALEASDRLVELDAQHTSEGFALTVNDDGVSAKSIDAFVRERKGVGGIASKKDAHATPQKGKGPVDLMLRVVSLWVGDSKSVVGNITHRKRQKHSREPPDTLTLTGPPKDTVREVGCVPPRDLEADPESESASKRATLCSGKLGNVA